MNSLPLPILLLLIFMTPSGLFAQEKEPAPVEVSEIVYLKATDTEAIVAMEGKKVVVYGDTVGAGKSKSGTNFVNFKDAEFYLITFKTDLIEFLRGEPADYYDKKRIAVTGVVSVFKGKPQFKLTDPSQVQILKPDAVFPPPKVTPAGPDTVDKPEGAKAPAKANPVVEDPRKLPPVDPKRFFK